MSKLYFVARISNDAVIRGVVANCTRRVAGPSAERLHKKGKHTC